MNEQAGTPLPPRGARERARVQHMAEVKAEARRQLATDATGGSGLSLRSIARALGITPSAVYRYFPRRDDLIAGLVSDAYDALGEAAERADADAADAADAAGTASLRGHEGAGGEGAGGEGAGGEGAGGEGGGEPAERWRAVAAAVRQFAKERPHEFALLFAPPPGGEHGPQVSSGAAGRVILVLAGILESVHAGHGGGTRPGPGDQALLEGLAKDVARLRGGALAGVPPEAVVRGLIAWTQLFGMVSLELSGHLAATLTDPDAFFDGAVRRMADYVGLGK